MRVYRYEKKQRLKLRRRSVDLEEQEDATTSDTTLYKGIALLFIGGICVAVAVYLALLAVLGGTSLPLPEPSLPLEPPPPPAVNDPKPGHWLFWRALSAYDTAATQISEYREKKKEEQKAKLENYEPPESDQVSQVKPEAWEPPVIGKPKYVPQATEKDIKRMEKNAKRRENLKADPKDTAADADTDTESESEGEPLAMADLGLKS